VSNIQSLSHTSENRFFAGNSGETLINTFGIAIHQGVAELHGINFVMQARKSGAQNLLRGAEKISFNEVYSMHWKELCSIAARITRNKEVAEDIVQEVFLSLLNRNQEQPIENIRAFLIQALKYQCFNWFRCARIASEHLVRMERAGLEYTTENDVNFSLTDQALHNIVSSMPDRCREVFEMSRFQQFTNEEIAARLNLSQRTVENHLTRALKILRVSLKTLLIAVHLLQ
jgi:RNA polymerase sigma-70 factor (family 1)